MGESPTPDRLLYVNGIDGDSGDYALGPLRLDELARLVERGGPGAIARPRRLRFGLDPSDLAAAGWGVIWPEGADGDIRDSLKVLLEHRRAQASRIHEERFRELTYLRGESTLEFWRRHGLGPDTVDPDTMPYYLLLVGGPDQIPFDVQSELGMPHAVGRLSFDDVEDYAAYARQLVDGDGQPAIDPPTIAFFGVENPGDEPTRASVTHLVEPLARKVTESRRDWRARALLRRDASKAQLAELLASPPNLLLTASHGMRYKLGSPRQSTHQGALVCADWPGRSAWQGALPDDFLFSAQDVDGKMRLQGLVAFLFACYSAGTPHLDPYAGDAPTVVADPPRVSSLPMRLLRQGARAIIGHVDVAFEESFCWFDAGSQIELFSSTLQAIMAGVPVGHAMAHFSDRLAILGALAADASWQARRGGKAGDLHRFKLWAAFQDARSFLILGDPAARLPGG